MMVLSEMLDLMIFSSINGFMMVKINDIVCTYHQYFNVSQIPVPFFPLFILGATERC